MRFIVLVLLLKLPILALQRRVFVCLLLMFSLQLARNSRAGIKLAHHGFVFVGGQMQFRNAS
jgi:hypothetical protein